MAGSRYNGGTVFKLSPAGAGPESSTRSYRQSAISIGIRYMCGWRSKRTRTDDTARLRGNSSQASDSPGL